MEILKHPLFSLDRKNMPRKGDEVLVYFTHITGPNRAYAQIAQMNDDLELAEFAKFQDFDLQNVELQKVVCSQARNVFFLQF